MRIRDYLLAAACWAALLSGARHGGPAVEWLAARVLVVFMNSHGDCFDGRGR